MLVADFLADTALLVARSRNPRTRNMKLRPQLSGFKVTASRDDVEAFADQWPGSGMHGKSGFSAEFDKNGDLVDLSGWAYDFRGDQSALSALIDDMRDFGLAQLAGRTSNPRKRNPKRRFSAGSTWRDMTLAQQRQLIIRLGYTGLPGATPNADFANIQAAALDMGNYNELERYLKAIHKGRKPNPATRGRKRRKIVSQAQWRALAAKMNRGEISKRDFDDMVGQSRPFRRLPKRKGSRRRNPSEKDINEEFEYLAGGPDRAFRIMRLSQRAREAVSGDQYNLSRRPRSVKDVFKAMAKREGHPQKAVDYYARHFM